ncbi:MAG: crossover junction endodeoxyribonuclease RuvC [bacterium]|nr:crossover junction endodeoxyribonuclease RuvC [bacterium]
MRILGIDPGYDRVGISIVEKVGKNKEVLIFSECFQTSSKDSFYTRLSQVGEKVSKIIKKYSPDSLAIESLFITKNQKTAMRVSEARGVIMYEAVKAGLPVFEYTPLQIKVAVTGHGSSDKAQIIKMIPLLIKLPDKKAHDDEYDAIAVALTCIAHEGKSFPQK